MANKGKFVDRNPLICSAGAANQLGETVSDLSHQYLVEDYVENLFQKNKNQFEEAEIHARDLPRKPSTYEGIEDCICPPEKTKFQEFYNKVYEAKYKSLKERPLGKSRDCSSKPENISNETTTFGRTTEVGVPLYDLVLPNKTPFQVIYEHEEGHDKYLLSHKHYFPAERINRKYQSPSFDPKLTFGNKTKVEAGGKLVKRALNDPLFPDYLCISNIRQREFLDRVRSKIGKPLQPHQILKKLPADYTFGVSTKSDRYSGEELIYNRDPYDTKTRIHESIAYLNRVRHCLKKRMGYDMEDMRLEAEEMDSQFTGLLDLKACLCIMKDHFLEVEEDKIRLLLHHFKMLHEDDKVQFKQFMNLLDCRHSVPDIGRLDDVFVADAPTLTTYRNFSRDVYFDDPACKVEPAGMPSQSVERTLPKVGLGTIRADMDSLTEETSVRTMLWQSTPTAFGVSHREYFLPRTKEEIRRIFSNIGYDLQEESNFEELWLEARNNWTSKDEMVSVDAFRSVLKRRGMETR